ncbi:MAG: inositol monophosphatase [Alphaproteobacteria bacterium]|nr:inositol monophosphatase [Alphaproteobacteria bacterium]
MPVLSATLNVMVGAVRKAARQVRRDFNEVEQLQVSRKGAADFVTQSDVATEKVLREELTKARPDFGFVLEEGGIVAGKDAEHRWHIDPIDGTTNFIHGVPHFCISVGLERAGTVIAGVIYNPVTDELYHAERGKGAFLNERRLRVSGRRDMAESLFATGLNLGPTGNPPLFYAQYEAITKVSAGIRRFGSAALDLAYVAAGRYEGFWEIGLNSWDTAAGIVLVREAGGQVSDLGGGGDVLGHAGIVAGNQEIHPQLLRALKAVKA